MRLTRNVGMLLLGIWLILWGLSAMFGLGIPSVLLGLVALLAGLLVLVGR